MWIILLIWVVIFALLLFYYFGGGKHDLSFGKKSFKICGLKEGFVPQGLCFSKSGNCFLMSGYMKNKRLASRVYLLDADGNEIKFVCIKSGERREVGHFGGIATFGDDVWISSNSRVIRIKLSDIKNAKQGDFVCKIDEFSPKNNASFAFTHAGLLWIGEFYRLGKFKTDVSHHIKIGGSNFHAMCFGYKIDPSAKFGVAGEGPVKAISIPDLAQGIAVHGDKIFVSCSYGISKSSLGIYKNVLLSSHESSVFVGSKKIPLYALCDSKCEKRLSLPAMSEELDIKGDDLFILFESASKKYRFLNRKRTANAYSFPLKIFSSDDV